MRRFLDAVPGAFLLALALGCGGGATAGSELDTDRVPDRAPSIGTVPLIPARPVTSLDHLPERQVLDPSAEAGAADAAAAITEENADAEFEKLKREIEGDG